jgi:hypothetical protein
MFAAFLISNLRMYRGFVRWITNNNFVARDWRIFYDIVKTIHNLLRAYINVY